MESYIPEDLLPVILSWLPLKSLVRFRCVSKSWLSLIDNDAELARLNLDTLKTKNDQTRLFVDKQARALKLWDPSLRDFSVLHRIFHSSRFHVIGIGYDRRAKDYKIVSLTQLYPDAHPSVAIYTVLNKSRRFFGFRGMGKRSSRSQRDWERTEYSGSVFLHGRLYFFAEEGEDVVWDLMSFDLSRQVFFCVSMPDAPDIGDMELVLVYCGSSVALRDREGEIAWVLERETMNWTKPGMPRTVMIWDEEIRRWEETRPEFKPISVWYGKKDDGLQFKILNNLPIS